MRAFEWGALFKRGWPCLIRTYGSWYGCLVTVQTGRLSHGGIAYGVEWLIAGRKHRPCADGLGVCGAFDRECKVGLWCPKHGIERFRHNMKRGFRVHRATWQTDCQNRSVIHRAIYII